MGKIAISNDKSETGISGSRLLPIIEYCVERGSTLLSASIERPFRATPNGGLCVVYGEIELKDIQAAFALPDDIIIGAPFDNSLWDKQHNNIICFES